ncbi:uncharacterized protein BT62DRAFT_903051, partial [Guyanagaster necrorhizus]
NIWDEFYLTAAYFDNLTAIKSPNGMMPYEKWHERRPDVTHLQEISCKAFMLIQNQCNLKIL